MLRVLATIFLSFFKIGLLTIGGGLVIIPLIQAEMVARGWLTTPEFLDILGIAQATPGPIGVNTATFVGFRVLEDLGAGVPASLLGALVATVAVSAPSVVGVHFGGGWFERNRERPRVRRAFAFIRPVVAVIVTVAGARLAVEALGAALAGHPGALRIVLDCAVCAAGFALAVTRRSSPLWALALGVVFAFAA